jgi:ankyrin repeat protein
MSAALMMAALQAIAATPVANVNTRDETGATPLMAAAQRADADLTARLLKAGANPNLRDSEGLGPLQIAIDTRATDVALLLLAHGADAKAARSSGETVLMTAARAGQFEVMKQLIARGANVNAREKEFHQTALMWSAGYPQQVQLLIQHGANVHARTRVWTITNTIYTPIPTAGSPWMHDGEYISRKGGQSALFFAVQADDLESVRALLDAGADVNDRAADGSTPLLLAVYKWNSAGASWTGCDLNPFRVAFVPNAKLADLLLDRGARVSVHDVAGYTPLHGAVLALMPQARMNPCLAIARHAVDAPEASSAAASVQEGMELVRRMLTLGADPNASTRYPTAGPIGRVRINPAPVGSTPMHLAADMTRADLMELMLARGGDPNRIRSDGHSPLSVATKADDLPMVELLSAHGGDVARTYNPTERVADRFTTGVPIEHPRSKQTLLHIAAVSGAANVVPFLAAQGVALNSTNADGETPLTLADSQERYRYERDQHQAAFDRLQGIAGTPDPDRIVRETLTSDVIKRLQESLKGGPGAESRKVLDDWWRRTEDLKKTCGGLTDASCNDEHFYLPILSGLKERYEVAIEPRTFGGVATTVVTPLDGISETNRHRVLINVPGPEASRIHGRGQMESIPIAALGRIEVVSVDYQQASSQSFPSAREGVAAVYKALLARYKPESIGIYGCSGGAVEEMLWFQKEGLPLPGAIGILSAPPLIGDAVKALPPIVAPFPATLIVTATGDHFMPPLVSVQSRLAQLGVTADLHVWDGLKHGFFFVPALPETREVHDVIVRFFDRQLARS